jgi:hypothetical protein
MSKHRFLFGFGTGLVFVYAWHHFVRPLPGGGATGAFSGKQ